jgi:putative restriction endonuclease
MEGWLAVTHQDWFDFLARRRRWDEINFWTPSDHYAFRGTPGAPFLFKLKSPRNAIGGFGIFSKFAPLPEWLAWECFGEGNGASSFEEMTARLAEIRARNNMTPQPGKAQIGCILLAQAVFFPPDMWIPQPSDWPKQNLRNKRYDFTVGEMRQIWDACLERAAALDDALFTLGDRTPLLVREQGRFGDAVLVKPRLGQGIFRVAVTGAYRRACAITGEHSLPALEAAHIVPYSKGGEHDVSNGLLLRSDFHRLFDKGYVTVTPSGQIEVSRRLKADYENGKSYYTFHGKELLVRPQLTDEWPAPKRLRWHNENVFLG